MSGVVRRAHSAAHVPGAGSRLEREHWPLVWTVAPEAAKSPITIFDLSELRGTVDVLRVSAGLAPVAWTGRAGDDPTFVAGKTPIRAVHFTQLRAALAELSEATAQELPPDFAGGEIVPSVRPIKLSDTLDVRRWVERHEAARPDLAARVVRRFGCYTLAEEQAQYGLLALDKPTEVWDAAGHTRWFYDARGRIAREVRVLDNRAYETRYGYDAQGRQNALLYPDGTQVRFGCDRRAGARHVQAPHGFTLGTRLEAPPSGARLAALYAAHPSAAAVWPQGRSDGRGAPVAVGDPARPALRLAYDGNGSVVKLLDQAGTLHLPFPHFACHLGNGQDTTERLVRYAPDGAGGRWELVPAAATGMRHGAALEALRARLEGLAQSPKPEVPSLRSAIQGLGISIWGGKGRRG